MTQHESDTRSPEGRELDRRAQRYSRQQKVHKHTSRFWGFMFIVLAISAIAFVLYIVKNEAGISYLSELILWVLNFPIIRDIPMVQDFLASWIPS